MLYNDPIYYFTSKSEALIMAQGWVCGPRMYEYKGWLFEHNPYLGAWPLKKDLEPRKRAGRVFWELFSEFNQLPKKEQEKLRVGGGCRQF